MYSRVTDTIHSGVSERYTLILDGGAGGVNKQPGDYLYHNGIARRFRQGAWGIMRVLPKGSADLQALPDYVAAGRYLRATGGDRRASSRGAVAGQPMPGRLASTSRSRSALSTFPNSVQGTAGSHGTSTSVTGAITRGVCHDVERGDGQGEGRHRSVGRAHQRRRLRHGELHQPASRRPSKPRVWVSSASRAVRPASTSASIRNRPCCPASRRSTSSTPRPPSIEAAQFSDFGGDATGKIGLYGAFVVHEKGAWFTDSGDRCAAPSRARSSTSHVAGKPGLPRRHACSFRTPIRRSVPTSCRIRLKVDGLTLVNYKNAGRRTDDFSGTVATPLVAGVRR